MVIAIDTVKLSIACEAELTSGRVCDWSTDLVISAKLWEEGFACWCPECGMMISEGWGMGQIDE